MTEKKWRRFFKREIEKEMVEIESILDEINHDPKMKDITAPEEMHDKLFAKIHEEEAKKARLTEEEKELIRLGKVYRKSRNRKKYYVLAAAVVCMLAIGITSIGGPAKIIEKVQGLIEGKEQINVDNEDGRVDEIKTISEAEAYQKIEDTYGFYPVELVYLPDTVSFNKIYFNENIQNVSMSYKGKNEETIIYFTYLNYRTGSVGIDVEDTLIETYHKEIKGVVVEVSRYLIKGTQIECFLIQFEYESVTYFLDITNVEKAEVEKIIENLYFG